MEKTTKNIRAVIQAVPRDFARHIAFFSFCLLLTGTCLGQLRSNPNSRAGGATSAPAPAQGIAARDLANLRSDFNILQEENQKLKLRMETLEQSLRERDEAIRELQNRLRILGDQLADNDRTSRERLDKVSHDISAEVQDRKSEMRKMAERIAKELSGSSGKPGGAAASHTPPVEYTEEYEIRVEKGDTLSSIAKAAGIPWSELKRYNGLKSDIIREGQRLKIPKK